MRLSSLGDVVLSASVLVPLVARGVFVDVLTSVEYAALFEGHPCVRKVYSFDRKLSVVAWVSLCRELSKNDYEQVIDLHSSLRTLIARVCFWYYGRGHERWSTYRKARTLRFFFFLLKKYTPFSLRPSQVREAYLRAAKGAERSKVTSAPLVHLSLDPNQIKDLPESLRSLEKYIIWAPGSLWKGKQLSISHVQKLISAIIEEFSEKNKIGILLVGSKDEGLEWGSLAQLNSQFIKTSFGGLSWPKIAVLMQNSLGVISNDSGLFHLAESLGKNAFVFYGPTHPDLGFAPKNSGSVAQVTDYFCSPCSKDGSLCFRLGRDRYGCMDNGQDINHVWPRLRDWIKVQDGAFRA